MTPEYLQGLAVHLLTEAGNPHITGVQAYPQAGVTGPAWTAHGLKVTAADGRVVYLSIVRGSSPTGDRTDTPTALDPNP